MRDDDISQLWGADDNGAWEPAPVRRPASPDEPAQWHPAATPNGNGNGHVDRLDALERDVRALVQAVGRVESLVNERLSRLEHQVAELAAADERRGQKGIGRLSGVIKSTRSH
jgi:hypothetical protein